MAMNGTPSISSPINWKNKFQLPSLPPLNVSLTAGTDIPPPPPEPESPPEPRQSPAERTNPLSLHPTTSSDLMPGAFPGTSPSPQQEPPTYLPRVQPTSSGSYQSPASPVSPSSTKRPSSIRRFLSLRSLNSNYNASPESPSSPISQRPGSPSAGSRPSLRKKKSGSWFRRRNSMGFDELVGMNGNALDDQEVLEEVENRRPIESSTPPPLERSRSPPPKLPELVNLDTRLDGGGLGAEDMFRNIT